MKNISIEEVFLKNCFHGRAVFSSQWWHEESGPYKGENSVLSGQTPLLSSRLGEWMVFLCKTEKVPLSLGGHCPSSGCTA